MVINEEGRMVLAGVSLFSMDPKCPGPFYDPDEMFPDKTFENATIEDPRLLRRIFVDFRGRYYST